MQRLIFSLLLCLFLYTGAAAQKYNTYFIKNDGQYVARRDSADYVRLVQEPDSGSKLYPIREFYLDGKKKSAGLSSKIDPPKYEGLQISYYKNGIRKEVANYRDGHLQDSVYTFYPNGKLYTFFIYSYDVKTSSSSYWINAVKDSTGKQLAQNGDGRAVFYDTDFKEVTDQGNIKNGKRDGIWTGEDSRSGTNYTETYAGGVLVSGESTDKKGVTAHYTKENVPPEFKGGMDRFYRYLSVNVNYPKNCIDNNIQGVAVVKFIVEKDGSITNIALVNYIHPDLAAEAIRVLRKSPLWTPGMNRGRASRVLYNVPVSFTLTD